MEYSYTAIHNFVSLGDLSHGHGQLVLPGLRADPEASSSSPSPSPSPSPPVLPGVVLVPPVGGLTVESVSPPVLSAGGGGGGGGGRRGRGRWGEREVRGGVGGRGRREEGDRESETKTSIVGTGIVK